MAEKIAYTLENHDMNSLKYFAEKYSQCSALEMLALIQKDPEFSVSSEERHGSMFYRIKLNSLKN